MSLHVLAAIYSSLGQFEEVIPVLERAIQVPDPPRGADHALAAFFGLMQLGDTFFMLMDRWIAQSLAMKKGLRSRSKP
ncbi:protein kinesin light chain-related 1 [Quercus suber]|uniref:Protein kinesin light chain-related 1 n=1 Tax=Quercus suber TaxID=58331 RepID=A0AAW0LQ43_QUESU|nr:isoform 2 of protein kinesin light chain-related 1 [Quercus suber]